METEVDEVTIEVREIKEEKAVVQPKVDEKVLVEPDMVLVKGGCFQMGDTFGDGEDDEQPVHEVCLEDYLMDKTEITQSAYEKVVGKNPSYFKNCPDCPVENVSWNDALNYCEKVGKRLPTEAEWEYAARSRGKNERFSGTSDESQLISYAWLDNNSGDKTHPVGKKKPNSLGLYDMSGNVWEWVHDWYGENYYQNSPKDNPHGATSGDYRVLRGGWWNFDDRDARCANRGRYHPNYRDDDSGFRCARTQ